MNRWKRPAAMAAVLGFCILAAAEAVLAFADPGPARSSKDIDVVVQDERGYQHFLVFETVPSKVPSWSRYQVEFWVDNWVSVDTGTVRRLQFETGSGLSAAGFVSSRISRNQPPHPDTVILEFTADRSTVQTLAAQPTSYLDWVMDTGAAVRFRVLDPAAFREAAGRAD